jgi:hypothetical protein
VSSRYLVGGSVLSWARSKLEGKIAQKREDVEYERSRGTPEGLADELETLAELEQDLRAATPQPEGGAVEVSRSIVEARGEYVPADDDPDRPDAYVFMRDNCLAAYVLCNAVEQERDDLRADLRAARDASKELQGKLDLACRGLREQTLAKFATEEARDRLMAETDRLKRDMAYYERGLERLRGVVEALDCIDRGADEAGIHREVVDRWRRGGE